MKAFKVAAVQMNALWDDVTHNLSVHDRFSVTAAAAGADLVLFPELSVTGHFAATQATLHAAPADRGRIFDHMHALARELGIAIAYGFCESCHGTFYNAHAVVGPNGLCGVQRKVHASGDEYSYFRMGRSFEVLDLGFCTLGTLICYDAEFFESWRVMALKGADLLLLPYAERSGIGSQLTRERQLKIMREKVGDPREHSVYASANALYALMANQWGFNGHSTHSGGAYAVNPAGEIIARSETALEDCMILVDVDPEAVHSARNGPSSLKMRRPEVYGELTRPY